MADRQDKRTAYNQRNQRKSITIALYLSDDEELAFYNFLQSQQNKKQTILNALQYCYNIDGLVSKVDTSKFKDTLKD